jgi:CheY-like chemotaxis protein
VLRAGDGAEALSLLAARAADVESVLLDLTMPGMPVQEVVSRMRRMAPGARIVLTSGYAQDIGAQAEFAGLPFLAKPYTPDDMLSLMCAPAPGA